MFNVFQGNIVFERTCTPSEKKKREKRILQGEIDFKLWWQ